MEKRDVIIVLIVFLSVFLVSCKKIDTDTEIPSHEPINLVDVEINGETLSIEYLKQEDEAEKLYGEPNPYTASVKQLRDKDLVGYTLNFGKISDEQAAVKVAISAFSETYGIDCVKGEQPFQVSLNEKASAWIVVGSLPSDTIGGVASIAIKKDTGEVLMIYHEK